VYYVQLKSELTHDRKAREKTVLRTIRLPKEYDDFLEARAGVEAGQSVNSILTKMIKRLIDLQKFEDERAALEKRKSSDADITMGRLIERYFDWDSWVEKVKIVTISRDGFKSILECADEEKLDAVAREDSEHAQEGMMMMRPPRYRARDYKTFLAWTALTSKYSYAYEIVSDDSDGENLLITCHHDLGIKWSRYLSAYLSQGFKNLWGIEPKIEGVTKQAVILRATILPRMKQP